MATPRVLIVDDEPDVVAFIGRLLQSEHVAVSSAYDGVSALDAVESDPPDLVLLDIMMPMMNGYEVCQQIKANPQTQHIPVVFLTSAHGADVRTRSLQAGATTVIVKPFSPAELIAQVHRHLPKASQQ